MDDLLKLFLGEEIIGSTEDGVLSLHFASGSKVAIYNKINWIKPDHPTRLTGQTLVRVNRQCNEVILKFDGVKLSFHDGAPDAGGPEVAAVYFQDGRIFIHHGDATDL